MNERVVAVLADAGAPRVGKLSPARMAALCANSIGQPDRRLLVGPGAGLDAAVLELADGRVMVVAEDPIFPAPGLPLETFGWFTAHIGASDVAVTGVRPSHMTYSLLLPPGYPERDTKIIVDSVSSAARDLGIAIVGGHTGWYGAVTIPVVGGITVWGFAERDRWISPGGARDGDVLLMTKGPGVEAAALLAVLRRQRLEPRMAPELLARVLARTREITVVEDALTAFGAGGVHAMHDATEGGVLTVSGEISHAAGIPVACNFDAVPVPEDIAAVAASSDSILGRRSAKELCLPRRAGGGRGRRGALAAKGISAWPLGRFDARLAGDPAMRGGVLVRGGVSQPLPEPGEDPFWRFLRRDDVCACPPPRHIAPAASSCGVGRCGARKLTRRAVRAESGRRVEPRKVSGICRTEGFQSTLSTQGKPMKPLVSPLRIHQLRTGLQPVVAGRRTVGGGPFGARNGW
jgi:hydrogenase maturation factor